MVSGKRYFSLWIEIYIWLLQVRVFDKGQVNSTYEELILSQICGKRFHELTGLHKDLLNRPLDPEIRSWLELEIGIKGRCFNEILALAKLKVVHLDPNDPSQFLNFGYQSLQLNSLKLKYICWNLFFPLLLFLVFLFIYLLK